LVSSLIISGWSKSSPVSVLLTKSTIDR
jgi:hypothetical protein